MESSTLLALIESLLSLDTECEWIEFKRNLSDPSAIGEYVSALANSAALHGQPQGFLLWGVDDETHEVVGTHFEPLLQRVGNQALTPWIYQGLNPEIVFNFQAQTYDGKRIVLLSVNAASHTPVKFKNIGYIRIESHKVELARHPAHEQQLWGVLSRTPPDRAIAATGLTEKDILHALNFDTYFQHIGMDVPENRASVLERMELHRFIAREQNGLWSVSTHAALLFAKKLDDFDGLGRKALRIVQYSGNDRMHALREVTERGGYAISFPNAIDRINTLLPTREIIVGPERTIESMLPFLAIRELLANALVHQDLTLTGTGPMVEIFPSRIEITNPGAPIVDIKRLIDAPPQSRNEALASMMRELRYCEERGSGWDKIALEIELHQLPAPTIEVTENHTRVVMLAHKPLSQLTRDERNWAVYIHACLLYCRRDHVTNTSIRERFGIDPRNSAQASRIISDAVSAGFIVPYDPSAAKRMMQYLPFWARQREGK